jgi:Uncharacterised protein family (UPF0158)
MKLTNEQINSIVDELTSGMNVYLNTETNEIKSIFDFDQHPDVDISGWREEIEELEKNPEKFMQIEKMDSRSEFRIMDDFVETVEDRELRKKLELGLSLSKPFRNFKDIIDGYFD